MFRTKGPPHLSLPIADVIDALTAIEAVTEVLDKRVMGFRVENHNVLSAKLGEVPAALTGGGHVLRIERSRDGWRVTKVEVWCS